MFSQPQGQALRYHYDPSRPNYASGYYPVMYQASGYTQQGMLYNFPYPGRAAAGFHHATAGTERESNLDQLFDRQMTLNNTPPPIEQASSTIMSTPSASAGGAARHRTEIEKFKLFAQEADHHKFEYTVNININRALFDDTHSPCFFSSLAVKPDPAALLKLIYHLSRHLHQADPESRYGYRPPRIDERGRWLLTQDARRAAQELSSERHAREETLGERTSKDSGHPRRRERRARNHERHEETTAPTNSRQGEDSRQSMGAASPHQRTPVPRRDNSSGTTPLSQPTDRQELEDLRERFIRQQVELEALKKKAVKTCNICYEADVDCVFLECLHMYCCIGCAAGCVQDGRAVCSICRKTAPAPGYVKVFMS